jgi:hypothetical protein
MFISLLIIAPLTRLYTKMSSPLITTSLSLAPRKHIVIISIAKKLAFEPNQIYAKINNIIKFNFLALNYTLI